MQLAVAAWYEGGFYGVPIVDLLPSAVDDAPAVAAKDEKLKFVSKLIGSREFKTDAKRKIWYTASTLINLE